MVQPLKPGEVFGLVHPHHDVHTMGVNNVAKLINDCGYKAIIGDSPVSQALAHINKLGNISLFTKWIGSNGITRLGFSYRLDPNDARLNFGKIYHLLRDHRQFKEQGGRLVQLYFSGLPEACRHIQNEYQNRVPVFMGDETPTETANRLGIPVAVIPKTIIKGTKYDDERISFAKSLIKSGEFAYTKPKQRFKYQSFGTKKDTVVERLKNNKTQDAPPLMRAHVGPYNPNYFEAKKEFHHWLKQLASTHFIDIVSIGSSQLSQSDFGLEWGDKPNGGGVPINSEQDLIDIYNVSRPLLLRTYAGTRNITNLANIYEERINMAWHALSLWWFSQIDGRGPYPVKDNLAEHFMTLGYIAKTGKPFEPNIPHHFAFRGSDDYSYVLSAYIAVLLAKRKGIKHVVLQIMLNTPKLTWGVQDLAKARALVKLVRELESPFFKVFLQPRAGLDYFSPDPDKARVQLAAVSAMMDDIEPANENSPDIIHVVSYCEAVKLATPEIINESIQITTKALFEYRKHKKLGIMDDMIDNAEVNSRAVDLYNEVKAALDWIIAHIKDLYSINGFYTIFKAGVFPVPYLWKCREEFNNAVNWTTGFNNGGVFVLNDKGLPVKPSERLESLKDTFSKTTAD